MHGHQRHLALARGPGDQFGAPVLTAPDKQLVRAYAVAPRDHGDGDAGFECLEDNLELLLRVFPVMVREFCPGGELR